MTWFVHDHPTVKWFEHHGENCMSTGLDPAVLLQCFHASSTPQAALARKHMNESFRQGSSVYTPLHFYAVVREAARIRGFPVFVVVRALLGEGADVEARTPCGDTILLAAARAAQRLKIVRLLVDRGADTSATSTAERHTRFGDLPHRQSALGLVLARQATYSYVRKRLNDPTNGRKHRMEMQTAIGCLRARGARLTDGDFFALWVDRARRVERFVLDEPYGAALTDANGWTFPPSYFRCARLLAANVRLRDGPLGAGLDHEAALLRRVFAFLARADVVGFFPDRLDSVLYSAAENKRYRKRGRED